MNKNSGYIGWSRSRRAAEAEDRGLLPLSRLGRGLFTRAAAEFLGPTERHHTSKYCNLTDFYDVRSVRALAAQMKATGLTAEAALDALIEKRTMRSVIRSMCSVMQSEFREARKKLLEAHQFEDSARRMFIRAECDGPGYWETQSNLEWAVLHLADAAWRRGHVRQILEAARCR
jgi:hypothetical protein